MNVGTIHELSLQGFQITDIELPEISNRQQRESNMNKTYP
jgi:hypothetical protein